MSRLNWILLPEDERLLVLPPGRTIFLHFHVKFRVASGPGARVFGHFCAPANSYTECVIPEWFFSFPFTALCGTNDVLPLFKGSTPERPADHHKANEIVDKVCESCHGFCRGIDSVLCKALRKVPSNHTGVLFSSATSIWGSTSPKTAVSDWNCFENPLREVQPEWDELVCVFLYRILCGTDATLEPESFRSIILGPQGSGKSTLCLFVINALLSVIDAVGLLDSDTGQPILTAPGMVSVNLIRGPLLGAPHSLINHSHVTNLLSIFLGALSPASCPRDVLAAVGQCAGTFAQFTCGALKVAASVENKAPDTSFLDLLKPELGPSEFTKRTGKVPRSYIIGNGTDPVRTCKIIAALKSLMQQKEHATKLNRTDISLEALGESLHSASSTVAEDLIECIPSYEILKEVTPSSDGPSHPGNSVGVENSSSSSMGDFEVRNTRAAAPPLLVNSAGWIHSLGWQLQRAIGALTWTSLILELVQRPKKEVARHVTAATVSTRTTAASAESSDSEETSANPISLFSSPRKRHSSSSTSTLTLASSDDADSSTQRSSDTSDNYSYSGEDSFHCNHKKRRGETKRPVTDLSRVKPHFRRKGKSPLVLRSNSCTASDPSEAETPESASDFQMGGVTEPRITEAVCRVATPFFDLVALFNGNLELLSTGVWESRTEFIPVVSKVKSAPSLRGAIRAPALRWLRFMATFHVGFRTATYLHPVLPEEFFAGASAVAVVPRQVKNPELYQFQVPRLLRLKLFAGCDTAPSDEADGPPYTSGFSIAVQGMSDREMRALTMSDIAFLLKGSLVHISIAAGPLTSLVISLEAARSVCYAFVHSVSNREVFCYVSRDTNFAAVEKANVIGLGRNLSFSPADLSPVAVCGSSNLKGAVPSLTAVRSNAAAELRQQNLYHKMHFTQQGLVG